jgi:8-oxo-dGTP pyrophosphatase MutT (NUDIX family)
MYKININEQLLILSQDSYGATSEDILHIEYSGQSINLLKIIHLLEESTINYSYVNIYNNDLKRLWDDFQGICKIIAAAGGIVESNTGKILAIHRRGSWDLPKGKIENGETIEAAAIREVEEETGITVLELKKKITTTYHTYRTKSGKLVLKPSHWYHMLAAEGELTPQVEEDIEQAVWIDREVLLNKNEPIYTTIVEVIQLSRENKT